MIQDVVSCVIWKQLGLKPVSFILWELRLLREAVYSSQVWIILSDEQRFVLKAFKLDQTNSALDFLYLQTILGFIMDRFLETENPQHCFLSFTE